MQQPAVYIALQSAPFLFDLKNILYIPLGTFSISTIRYSQRKEERRRQSTRHATLIPVRAPSFIPSPEKNTQRLTTMSVTE
jgi:hypothetical protein